MGLFRKPLSEEEQQKKQRYEDSKVRLMELHKTASSLFYIDEITTDEKTGDFVLIGEVGIGTLHDGDSYAIYSNEGIPIGQMTLRHQEEREERHFIPGRTIRTFCFPEEAWDGYLAGQMLVQMPD